MDALFTQKTQEYIKIGGFENMKKVIYLILFALSIGLANAQNTNEWDRLVKLNLKSVYDEQVRRINTETGALRRIRGGGFKTKNINNKLYIKLFCNFAHKS